MSLNMHGTQYGLSQHTKLLQMLSGCAEKTSKCNVNWAGSRYIALPRRQL